MPHQLAAWTFAIVTALSAVEAEPAGETAAPVAPALESPAESAAVPVAPALLGDLDQLARCNPFRPIGLAGKLAAGESTGSSEKGSEGTEGSSNGTAKTPAPAPDALTLLKKSLVVSAIVSTDDEIYAVIGGKRYYVGDEVAPKIRISKITRSGVTVVPAEDPQP